METITRKKMYSNYNFEVLECEVSTKGSHLPKLKACIKQDEKIKDVEFTLEEDILIGNEKKLYANIDSYLKTITI